MRVWGCLMLTVLCALTQITWASGCKDENGAEVKWFVALREPNSRKYLYFSDASAKFRQLRDEEFLNQLFQAVKPSREQLLLWNDEPAVLGSLQSLTSLQYAPTAHDKGVLYQGKDGRGFFLLHSVPKYPSIVGGKVDSATPAGSVYGQSMVCLTLTQDSSYSTIWSHVRAQRADIYHDTFNLPEPRVNREPTLESRLEGRTFNLVTKTALSLEHPFEDMLAGIYKTGWLVESWGRPYQPNRMQGYRVVNNRLVNFPSASFKSTSDHSKWAVALDADSLVCIGGMNHMESQAKRGGQFLCFKHKQLYQQLYYSIASPDDAFQQSD